MARGVAVLGVRGWGRDGGGAYHGTSWARIPAVCVWFFFLFCALPVPVLVTVSVFATALLCLCPLHDGALDDGGERASDVA